MTQPRRLRRSLVLLAALGALLLVGAWWVNRQLEPRRLTTLVLGKAGTALQLKIGFKGEPEYALKPEPRLVIPSLTLAASTGGKPFLTARRVEISLPWATITGGEPVITRLQLDAPVLDLAGMRRWIASLPEKPFELPTLTKGLRVSDGTIIGDGYSISALQLDVARLKTGEKAEIEASGRFQQGTTRVDFDARLAADTPGLASDFTLDGSGFLIRKPEPLKFKLQAAGHYASTDALFSAQLVRLALSGTAPLPSLQGKGSLTLGKQMQWAFDGVLASWPKAWPALPKPLDEQTSNLPLHLAYAGRPDLGDPITLTVDRAPTVLDASLRLAELNRWLSASNPSPLPPVNGKFRTPALVFDGVELRGVEVELSDGPLP